ncbi:Icp55 [Kluyveromyces lactis]|nr:Icp55 [Kluyveromyces lactis]
MFKNNILTSIICRNFHVQSGLKKFVNRQRLPINCGQPIHETRPYLLKAGELTPGITALEYFKRRVKLADRLAAKSCAIIAGSQVKYASGAVFYPFQQNNDMYYLTGWNEPDSVMIIEKPNNNPEDIVLHMMVPPKDPFAEKWEGFRTGVDGVKEIFNADEATSNKNLERYISTVIRRCDYIYFDHTKEAKNSAAFFSSFFSMNDNNQKEITILNLIKNATPSRQLRPLKGIVAELRSIKSPAELRIMRRAGQISGRAYNQAYARRFRNERTLGSFLEYKFIEGGCDRSAYIPVIGTGDNALCIHYTRNDDVMFDDEMVLVDAAGAIGGYCSDISRTWPVSGKFTDAQKDLYEVVLAVQKKCIELCAAHNVISLHQIHEKSLQFFKQELKNIGLNSLSNWDINEIYPHYIGHNLGLDVHDVPELSRHQPLQEGQVITIEPGLYIPNDPKYPEYFRNIGIRIEDDIAIGLNSYTNLTVEAAKEVIDIENIVQHGVSTKIDHDIPRPLDF